MITALEIQQQVNQALDSGASLEDCLYQVSQSHLKDLPEHLKADPQEISTVLCAVQNFAAHAHPEFLSGANLHDLVLLRLLPKAKTERYIQELNNNDEV